MYFAFLLSKPLKILFAPLDWGLGHVTRCIPLIQYCEAQGHQIFIAGEELCFSMLQPIFPNAMFVALSGYDIRYSKKKWQLPFRIMLQLPKLFFAVFREQNQMQKIVKEFDIQLVFSDNRYGLFHKSIKTIFITHQVNIQIPHLLIVQKMANQISHFFIGKFSECWVPDYASPAMAGKLSLSHPSTHFPITYIGNLSRMQSVTSNSMVQWDVLILLSGPEPQRTIFENILCQQFAKNSLRVACVRGKPLDKNPSKVEDSSIQYFSHLPTETMQQFLQQASIVICRAGYSSIMDLIKINKHAILVPTPGQTEQEYLGNYLQQKKWFLQIDQNQLHRIDLLDLYAKFSFQSFPAWDMELYKSKLKSLLDTCQASTK